MAFAIYDTATGDILRLVTCPPESLSDQFEVGQSVIEVGVDVSDTTHRVVLGEPVRIAT